jgi:hypothetical protein
MVITIVDIAQESVKARLPGTSPSSFSKLFSVGTFRGCKRDASAYMILKTSSLMDRKELQAVI